MVLEPTSIFIVACVLRKQHGRAGKRVGGVAARFLHPKLAARPRK